MQERPRGSRVDPCQVRFCSSWLEPPLKSLLFCRDYCAPRIWSCNMANCDGFPSQVHNNGLPGEHVTTLRKIVSDSFQNLAVVAHHGHSYKRESIAPLPPSPRPKPNKTTSFYRRTRDGDRNRGSHSPRGNDVTTPGAGRGRRGNIPPLPVASPQESPARVTGEPPPGRKNA